MRISSFPIICSLLLPSCFGGKQEVPAGLYSPEDVAYQIRHGVIQNPFFVNTNPIGRDAPGEKFVIRTIVDGREHVIEIPHGGRDYNIEMPLAEITDDSGQSKDPNVRNPQLTDREMVANMPEAARGSQGEKQLMDKAFGVGDTGGTRQAPSYTMGLHEINKYYTSKRFEIALIKINNLIAFYPNSAKLYKMKGSALIKLGNLRLAKRAWRRASELDPSDPIVRKGISRIESRLVLEEQGKMAARANQPAAPSGDAAAEEGSALPPGETSPVTP